MYIYTDINAVDNEGNTALLKALRKRNVEIALSLLKHPEININIKSKNGDNALCCAIEYGYDKIVEIMLNNHDVDVNCKNSPFGDTPLIAASKKGNKKILKMLLRFPYIDINAKNRNGETALIVASNRNDIDIVRLLVKKDLVKEKSGGVLNFFKNLGCFSEKEI